MVEAATRSLQAGSLGAVCINLQQTPKDEMMYQLSPDAVTTEKDWAKVCDDFLNPCKHVQWIAWYLVEFDMLLIDEMTEEHFAKLLVA